VASWPASGEAGQPAMKMVGRTAELAALQTAFCAVVEKHEFRMVTVIGEAGIGKSRLLREFQKWFSALPHCVTSLFLGRAEPETAGQPFSLIRAVFRSRFEIQDSDSVNVAREKFERGYAALSAGGGRLSQVPANKIGRFLGFDFPAQDPDVDMLREGQETRRQIFQSLGVLFTVAGFPNGHGPNRASAADQTGLIVLDDLQWSDDDSLDLLAYLAKNHPDARAMVLTLARPSLLERRPAWGEGIKGHRRMVLEPLSLRESEMLVETIMSQAEQVPAAIRETILADAGGHPFYIEEVIKVLMEKKVILRNSVSWQFDTGRLAEVPVSATLRGVLRARLDGLPPPERRVIQCASAVGSVFWDNAIESLCGTVSWPDVSRELISPQAVPAVLANLCRKDLIHRRESSGFSGTVEYIFKHDLLRDVAFETLPKKARCEQHARVAAWLVEHGGERIREFSGLVAVHFEQAGQLGSAAEWYARAGEQAWNSFAPGAAADYFQKAIHLFRLTPEGREKSGPLAWHEGLSNALTAAGRFTDALTSFGQACTIAKTAGDFAGEARAWCGLAYLHERCAEYRASIEAAEQAQGLARRAGDRCAEELIRSAYLKGWALYRLSDAPAVLALAAQALELCEKFGKRNWLASCHKLYGVANLQLGRYREAERYFDQGLALCLELGDRRSASAMFSNLGESARLQGHFQQAVSLYQQALEFAREIGDRPAEMLYLSNLGGARLGLEQFPEAEMDLRQAIAIRGLSKSCGLAETYDFLAQACLGQQKLAEAMDAARQAVIIGLQMENPLELAGSWRALGRVLAALTQSGAPDKCSLPMGPSPLICDASQCFAESVRVYQAIGAADEQARTAQIWAGCQQSISPTAASRAPGPS